MFLQPSVQLGVMALFSGVVMLALWFYARAVKNVNVVDAAWSGCLACGAVFVTVTATGAWERRLALAILAGLWSLRLTWHLVSKRVFNAPEDRRYQRMRSAMGRWQDPLFLLFFMVQAGFVVLFSIPLVSVAMSAAPFPSVPDIFGLTLGVLAVMGESVADRQLTRFISDPANRGKTCDVGLWRYSRHPNYFFEWLLSFSYPLLAVGSPWFLVACLAPVVVLTFLLFITGIPHVERECMASRQGYAGYAARTPRFIPWFPREVRPGPSYRVPTEVDAR